MLPLNRFPGTSGAIFFSSKRATREAGSTTSLAEIGTGVSIGERSLQILQHSTPESSLLSVHCPWMTQVRRWTCSVPVQLGQGLDSPVGEPRWRQGGRVDARVAIRACNSSTFISGPRHVERGGPASANR